MTSLKVHFHITTDHNTMKHYILRNAHLFSYRKKISDKIDKILWRKHIMGNKQAVSGK